MIIELIAVTSALSTFAAMAADAQSEKSSPPDDADHTRFTSGETPDYSGPSSDCYSNYDGGSDSAHSDGQTSLGDWM